MDAVQLLIHCAVTVAIHMISANVHMNMQYSRFTSSISDFQPEYVFVE